MYVLLAAPDNDKGPFTWLHQLSVNIFLTLRLVTYI